MVKKDCTNLPRNNTHRDTKSTTIGIRTHSLGRQSSFPVGVIPGAAACVRRLELSRMARNAARVSPTFTRRAHMPRHTLSRTQGAVFTKAAQLPLGILAFRPRQTAALSLALGRGNFGRFRRTGASPGPGLLRFWASRVSRGASGPGGSRITA